MKIIILSRNEKLYSTQRLLEAVRLHGHEGWVVDPLQCHMVIEGDSPSVRYQGKALDYADAIIPRIGASITDFGSAVVRQFEMMKVFTTVKSQAIVRSRNKLRSLQILSKAGVGIPKTVFANHPDNINELIKQVGGPPVVIKLLEGTQGVGVVLAETKKSARSVVEAFNGLKANVLIQEYIAEAQGADVRVFVVGEEIVCAMKRQSMEGEFRSNLHRGGSSQLIDLNEQERQTALAAAKALGVRVAGVDMLQSSRGPLIMEVNSSPGLEGIEHTTHLDVASRIVRFIEDNIRKRNEGSPEEGDKIEV